MSWHPNIKQRLICSTDNQYIEDISLRESVPIAFAPDNALTFASNETLYLGMTNTNTNTSNNNNTGVTSTSTAATTGAVATIQTSRILPSPDVIPFTGIALSYTSHMNMPYHAIVLHGLMLIILIDEHGIEGDISSVIRRRVELGMTIIQSS